MILHFTKIGTGPPLIILHGLYGSGDNWMNIARELMHDFTVYLVDQRNHGKSPQHASHTYEELAGDLKLLCDNEKLKELNIIGHSMGGKTAITFTLLYPGLVQKLVNVDISPYSYLDQQHFSEQINYHKLILRTFKTAPIKSFTTRAEVEAFFLPHITYTSTRRFLLKNLKRHKSDGFYWQLNVDAIANNLIHVIDAAPPVKLGAQSFIPTIFIRGGKSPYISDDEMDAIPDVFPNSQFISFENSGHWLHAEEPGRFIARVKKFLMKD